MTRSRRRGGVVDISIEMSKSSAPTAWDESKAALVQKSACKRIWRNIGDITSVLQSIC